MTWRLSGKSRFQQEIGAIYPSTLRMTYAVLISVIFRSSMAHGDLGTTEASDLNPS